MAINFFHVIYLFQTSDRLLVLTFELVLLQSSCYKRHKKMEEAKYEDWKTTVVHSIKKNPEKGVLYYSLVTFKNCFIVCLPSFLMCCVLFQDLRKLYRLVSISQRRLQQKRCKLIHSQEDSDSVRFIVVFTT